MTRYSEDIARVSTALADPTRREIMELVLVSGSPLSVREVADHFGLHANAARMHLDKLVRGGLLRVVRRRGERGGRPAHLYSVSGEERELSLPPRRYKLLAEVLASSMEGLGPGAMSRVGQEAFMRGREEALASSSRMARLPRDADLLDVARAWQEEISQRGHRADMQAREDGSVALTFLTCPFGEFSRARPELVCEIHRRLEEGFLSLAGEFRLRLTPGGCTFVLGSPGG